MTHEKDEDLSALIDGELPAEAAARVRTHAAACAQCASRLERLGAASSAFKRSGEQPIPRSLVERVWAKLDRRRRASLELVLVMVATLGVVLVSGAMLKKFMPSLFNNINTAITGAAGQMGQGGAP